MDEKPIQLEIFDGGYSRRKAEFAFRNHIDNSKVKKFPAQLCAKAAVSIIVIAISFAMGFEHGKRISVSKNIDKSKEAFVAETKSTTLTQKTPSQEINLKENQIKIPPLDSIKKLEKKEKNVKVDTYRYIIQVATYKKNSSFIEKETAKLEQKGYKTSLVPSGGYIQVCAGKFINKEEANLHLQKLKLIYKDCYIRKI